MDCPLYMSGRKIGFLRVTEEGRDTRFTVRASAPGGLYRLYARGERGELLLGAWEGGAMSRRFSREMTAPMGRILSADARPVCGMGEPWTAVPSGTFRGWPAAGGICRRCGETWQLALPFDDECPFPLTPLFCLACVTRVEGRQRAVFCFDREGRPVFPSVFSDF